MARRNGAYRKMEWTPEQRAVREFEKMRPQLESFAYGMTGRRLPVVVDTETFTDGKTIHVSLPLKLTREVSHDRVSCDKTKSDGSPLCEACASRESILSLIFHEIGHIASDSFKSVPRREFGAAIHEVASRFGYAKSDALMERAAWMARDLGGEKVNAQRASADVSPFVKALLMGTEDARVNRLISKTRPGAGGMIRRNSEEVMSGRAMRADGTPYGSWAERSLNSQFVIGALAHALGHDPGQLDADVMRVVRSLDPFIEAAASARDVVECFGATVVLMAEAQRFGFFLDDNENNNLSRKVSDDDGGESEPGDKPSEPPAEDASDAPPGSEGESSGGDEDSSADAEDKPAEAPSPGDDDGGGGEPLDDDDEERGSSDSEAGGSSGEPEGSVDDSDGDEHSTDEGGSSSEDEGDASSGGGEDATGDPSGGDSGDDLHDADGAGPGGGPAGLDDPAGEEASEVEGEPAEGVIESGGDPRDGMTPGEAQRIWDPTQFGTSDDAEEAMESFIGHDDEGEMHEADLSRTVEALVSRAIETVAHMDEPSPYITSVDVKRQKPSVRDHLSLERQIDKTILNASLMRLRRAFDDNKRASHERNRRSGRVSSRVLGRRAWNDDERLFTKKSIPGKRDYAVLVGVDISGSTSSYGVLDLLKGSAYVQAELCARLGVKFAIYAHTGDRSSLIIKEVKTFDEAWDTQSKQRLAGLTYHAANLDGHTMEFYRKRLQEVQATDKVLMYYTDGAMPLENYEEELAILKREIKKCQQLDISLMSVGVGSDDPRKHGLDHVRIDSMSEILKVAQHLEKRLGER